MPCRTCGGRANASIGTLSAALAAPQWEDAGRANNRSLMHPTGALGERAYDDSGRLDAERIAVLAPPEEYPRIVDLGCGDGRVTRHLADQGYQDVLGVDAAPSMIFLARRRLSGRIRVVQGDGRNLATQAPDVDAVAALGVLPFLSIGAGAKVLRGIAAALRPGGRLIADVDLGDARRPPSWSERGTWDGNTWLELVNELGLAIVPDEDDLSLDALTVLEKTGDPDDVDAPDDDPPDL